MNEIAWILAIPSTSWPRNESNWAEFGLESRWKGAKSSTPLWVAQKWLERCVGTHLLIGDSLTYQPWRLSSQPWRLFLNLFISRNQQIRCESNPILVVPPRIFPW